MIRMGRLLVKNPFANLPQELVEFLDDPPLVGVETIEGYKSFFCAIVADLKPADAIDWLYLKDVVDLSWQIRRERVVLAGVVKSFQMEVVRDLLKATVDTSSAVEAAAYRIFNAANDAQRWASDPAARKEIDARLSARGHSAAAVLAQAYIRGASHIDAIDKRIASYEARRVGIVRQVERRSAKLARDLATASSEVIDAEFSEAAE
jgi:hypothetical protein